MFDKGMWVEWAKQQRKDNPEMQDFRSSYWHSRNIQEQGTNKVDLQSTISQVINTTPTELNEAGPLAAVLPAMGRMAAGAAAGAVADKLINKKKKDEGAGEENRAKGTKSESIIDDEEQADEDDEEKAGKEDDKKEGAGEENRAKGKKVTVESLENTLSRLGRERIDEAGPLAALAAPALKMAGAAAVGALGKKFKKSKQAGEPATEENEVETAEHIDNKYTAHLKRKRAVAG